MKKKSAGRPRKKLKDKFRTPVRAIGRVNDGDWSEIKAAVAASGQQFSSWAASVLLAAARLLKNKSA